MKPSTSLHARPLGLGYTSLVHRLCNFRVHPLNQFVFSTLHMVMFAHTISPQLGKCGP
jgi:hypothetical protein